ncbi:MAG: DUF262 domain-containing protein [Nanoarchaeota archaeon]|nr:DUF262 domain-containing protein [Nanoarchaeota archaeon]
MSTIYKEKLNQWSFEAIRLLQENGGKYRSRDLIRDLEKRLDLSNDEKSLNNSGQPRWLTSFRFHTIGLVKAGLIKKEKGFWWLTNEDGIDLDKLTPKSLAELCDKRYQQWLEKREQEAGETGVSSYLIEDPFVAPLNNLTIKPRPVSFDELLKGVDKSLIQIPPFQREFVWSPKDICFLLDSIYRGYPIGSFIFWKTMRRLPHHREIGGLKLNDIPVGSQIDYVLDGQQRITSLYAAIRGASIDNERYVFYFNLNNGRFQSEKVKEDGDSEKSQQNKIPLEKLFVESHSEYMRYTSKFLDTFQDLLHDLYGRFKMYALSVIYVQEEDESDDEEQTESVKKIVSIFSRINETGRKLSVVAKMVARCWGEGFDIREKFDELYKNNKELKEIREETILQAASAILNQRRSRTRDILETTDIQQLENEWDNIIEAFKIALEFIRNKIKIKSLKYLPFDTLLVPLAYFHYKKHNPSNSQIKQLQTWFWKACLSNRFGSTVESKIEEDCEEFDKILEGEKTEFAYQIDWETFKTRLIGQDYNLRNAFCKTILSLYSYFDPKSLKDGRDIDIDYALTGYYKNNLHHFFPRKYLEKVFDPQRDRRDSVVNIAFAPAIVNIEMSDTAPSEYVAKFKKENPEIDEILKSHLIDDVDKFGIPEDNFAEFLEKRAERIENQFRMLLGLRTKTEQQFDEEPSAPLDLLEIRLRSLIQEKLTEDFDDDFWLDAVPADIRQVVEKKIEGHVRAHPYDIDKFSSVAAKLGFLDIMDYAKIISTNWSSFSGTFQSRGELEKHFLALKNYRNAVKHNREMNQVEKRNGEAAVLWFNSVLVEK